MSFFDRFTSKKGKEEKAIKTPNVNDAKKNSAADQEKKAFAAVSSGKTELQKASQPADKPTAPKTSTHRAGQVLVSAVVTEKSTMLARQNQYVFAIAQGATKVDVRQAVQHVYGIRPTDVTMVNLPGKIVRYGRTHGRTPARKKAVVTLPAGKTIDLTVS